MTTQTGVYLAYTAEFCGVCLKKEKKCSEKKSSESEYCVQQCVPTKKVARNERHLGYSNEAKTCLEAETPLACAAGIGESTTKREKGYIVDRPRDDCVCAPTLLCERVECVRNRKRLIYREDTPHVLGCARQKAIRTYIWSEKNERTAVLPYSSTVRTP